MSKQESSRIKSFKTPEGIKISTYISQGKKPTYHSLEGPAIKYPKHMKKSDEYFIYGIPYSKERWLELKNDVKVTTNPFPTDGI